MSAVSLLNPVRFGAAMANFTHARRPGRADWIVNLALDLNVLVRMERCVFHACSLEETGLTELVRIIDQPGTGTVLLPGFAIGEVKVDHAPSLRAAYEAFVATFLPGFVDSPGATLRPDRDAGNSRYYDRSPDTKRQGVATFYIAMLLLFIVARREALEPQRRFTIYLQRLAACTGTIGAVEARIAQFVFYDRAKLPPGPWSTFCRSIRDNFLKSSGTPDKVRLNAYNQAHDLYLLRSACTAHGQRIDGRRTDFWIAAVDEGLVNLASTFYFELGKDGFWTGQFGTVELFSEMMSDPFWQASQRCWSRLLAQRGADRQRGVDYDLDFGQMEAAIAALHSEMDAPPR